MQKDSININADLGEMAGQDEVVMPYLSSCNIATGGHIGDADSIQKTMELAVQNKVKIGAHPSYPDHKHFGRTRPQVSDDALKESLVQQLLTFYEIAKKSKVEVHHIKPHGALYHDVVNDKEKAQLFLSVLDEIGVKTQLYTLKNGFLHQFGGKNHKICTEAFMDRRYTSDLNLVNRKESNALIMEPKEVWKQLYMMAFQQQVEVVSGALLPLSADTFCIHGDHPNASAILHYINAQLTLLKP